MSSLITVEIQLPSRVIWTALKYADRWLSDRIEPDETSFFVTATGSELMRDQQLCDHFVHLVGTTPGLCARLRERLDGQRLGDFDVLQLVFLHDQDAPVDASDPADAARSARALLTGTA